MNESKIRDLKPSDRAPIEKMLTDSGFFTLDEVKVALELFDTAIKNPAQTDYIFGVSESGDGKVLGYVCYGSSPMAEGTFDIYWICVDPQSKNLGIGKKLMAWAEKRIKDSKGRLIIVETSGRGQYDATRGFYLKQHYIEEARIKDFYRPGDDRVIYTKHL